MIANGDGMEGFVERQDIVEERAGQAIGNSCRPFGFQEQQFRGGPFGQ